MADTAGLRKDRGAFFTPDLIAQFIADWAIRAPSDAVLEPSCGEAAFLTAAGSRLRSLGAEKPSGGQLQGIEIHEESLQNAAGILSAEGFAATLTRGNFFDARGGGDLDAVVGNPPYIRYQKFIGTARAKAQEAALAQGVRLQGLANSWAAFVVHASTFLNAKGRLGLVLPAELLTVKYAGPVRKYLMQRFASVRLVLFEERVFPGVSEEVVLLLAEGTGPTDHFELYQAQDLAALAGSEWRSWAPRAAEEKWIGALLPTDAAEIYSSLVAGESFSPLLEWGDTDLGSVTGNNRYFALTAREAKDRGLDERDLLRICPPGSRHLKGLTFTERTWQEMAEAGAKVFLFYPRKQALRKAAQRYIDSGTTAGVEKAYKCRVRDPWWRVPLVRTPDLFFTYMNHHAPRVVANRPRVHHLNSIYGVTLHNGARQLGMDLLPMAMLNSVTFLGSELVGRSYGGGILKCEPTEADQLPVPSQETLEAAAPALRALRPQLAKHLRRGELSEVVKQVDRALLTRHLRIRTHDVRTLRSAREGLFARRVLRSKNKK